MNISAIILAAGMSTRQDGFKPLLRIGKKTVLEHCLDLFFKKGVGEVLVVLGPRAEDLKPLVLSAGAKAVENPDYKMGMFSSVQAGVAQLLAEMEAFFVLPVDIPLVRGISLDILINGMKEYNEIQAFIPSFAGKTGHPPLIRSSLCPQIAEHDGQMGLRGVLKKVKTKEILVPDQHILLDLDTPDKYQKALKLWDRYKEPSPEEAEILLEWEARDNQEVIAHSHKVAQVAEGIAQALNSSFKDKVDIDLVKTAALLHDIAKGKPSHAEAGAKRLADLGFSKRLTEIVACHADYDPDHELFVDETEIVYLADKLVQGDKIVGLDSRFEAKYEKFSNNPEARQAVLRRWEQARFVKKRVEEACGGGVT